MSGLVNSLAGYRSSKETIERPHTTLTDITIFAGRIVLLAALTLAAWLFGGVQARVQVWLFVALAFVSGTWLISLWSRRRRQGQLPLAALPLFLALAMGVLQLVPVGQQALAWLSPKASALRQSLASESNPSDTALIDHLNLPEARASQPISLSPASTRKELALLLSVAAGFALGAVLFSKGQGFVWPFAALAANGGILAFFGIVQWLTFNGKIFWTVPLTYGGAPFGPFVNRNNAGGFLLVCLAASLAMTVWVFRRDDEPGQSEGYGAVSDGAGSWLSRRWESAQRFLSRLDAWRLTWLSFTACIVAGVACSLSRGAVVAMLGAALVTTFVVWLARRRDSYAFRLGAVALLAGAGLVSWAGMNEPVRARMASLLELSVASKPRMDHWRDTVRAVPDFWRTGSGLGTYRFIYEAYQREPHGSWFMYAENMYLETLVETGAAGLVLVFASTALVGIACWRLLRRGPDAAALALGVAGVFALSGQALAALVDFGLRVPANSLALAVLCGTVTGNAAALRWKERTDSGRALGGRRLLPAMACVALLSGLIWGCLETKQAAAVEIAMRQMDRLGQEGCQSRAEVRRALEGLEQSVEQRPDDAQALCCLARLQIHLYRLESFERFCRQVSAQVNRDALWKATLPLVLHGRIQQYAAAGDTHSIARIRSERAVSDHLLPALGRLVLSRRACPLLPEVHLLIAELGVLASEPEENEVHLTRVERVAPANPLMAFERGIVELQAGRTDAALSSWRRCLALDDTRLPEIVRRLRIMGTMPESLDRVLPDSPPLLIQVAEDTELAASAPELRERLLDRAASLIERNDYPEDERRHLCGEIRALQGQRAEAIDDYLRAVALRPQSLSWRYELALLLKRESRLAEAHEQARYCAVMEPASRKYEELLEEISRSRITAGEDLR